MSNILFQINNSDSVHLLYALWTNSYDNTVYKLASNCYFLSLKDFRQLGQFVCFGNTNKQHVPIKWHVKLVSSSQVYKFCHDLLSVCYWSFCTLSTIMKASHVTTPVTHVASCFLMCLTHSCTIRYGWLLQISELWHN